MGYGRNYGRRGYSRPQTTGRVSKANARPGNCRSCGVEIPAGAGQLWREDSGAWSVVHLPREWAGSPVSGQWTYGCPDETDRLNGDGALPEHERIASAAAIHAARTPEPARQSRSYACSGRRGRCEDAPCCGCCD